MSVGTVYSCVLKEMDMMLDLLHEWVATDNVVAVHVFTAQTLRLKPFCVCVCVCVCVGVVCVCVC
jgi:hypothetical protein